jgi:FHA domain-containing protein
MLGREDRTQLLALSERTALHPESVPAPPPAAIAPREEAKERPRKPAATLNQALRKASIAEAADRQPRQSASGTQADTSGEALWRGFLEGAGITITLPDGPSAKVLREIGEMLKIAVVGIQSLVMIRARAKNQLRAEMTMIQARDNNPLKFSPDAQLALERILEPSARGFLNGSAALRDALADLQSHQVGMAAAMRSVLESVLDRLDPGKIEALRPRRSLLDWLNPARRKARLWDSYVKRYRALCDDAQDDFARNFGETLRETYEVEVRNIDTTSDRPVAG